MANCSTQYDGRVRLIDREQVDLLEWHKVSLGRDFCDELSDCRDGLLNLPAAIQIVEQMTGKSVNRNTYELSGTKCQCTIRLPHPPICDLLSFEKRLSSGWVAVDSSKYEFVNSEDCPHVKLSTNDVCCGCSSTCGCPQDTWRLRYVAGSKQDCELTSNPLLLRAVLKTVEWLETDDKETWRSIERLVELSKTHLVCGSSM